MESSKKKLTDKNRDKNIIEEQQNNSKDKQELLIKDNENQCFDNNEEKDLEELSKIKINKPIELKEFEASPHFKENIIHIEKNCNGPITESSYYCFTCKHSVCEECNLFHHKDHLLIQRDNCINYDVTFFNEISKVIEDSFLIEKKREIIKKSIIICIDNLVEHLNDLKTKKIKETDLIFNKLKDNLTELKKNYSEAKLSIDSLIKHLENTYGNTIDMTKIIIGVAPYTRGWSGVKNDGLNTGNPGLYATSNSSSVKSADGTISGIYGFNELPTLIKQFDLLEYFDNTAKAAYYYSPKNGYFFSCDNEESVAAKGKYVKEKKLGGLASWMASYDPENKIARAMFNSLYEEGYQFPERDLIYNLISVSCTIKATENGYTIRIQNNGMIDETNNALIKAELFKIYILNLKIYIKSKSGAVFGEGPMSGTVTNKNGEAIIDPSSNPESKIILDRYNGYTFSVTVSGTPNVTDIATISVSQRILPSLKEFKKRIVYDNR